MPGMVGGYGAGYSGIYGGYPREGSRNAARSIFNQGAMAGAAASGHVPFRDFAQEAAEMAGDASVSAASSRRNRLAELFKPPFDIMHRGDFSSARLAARESGKWVLINIQDVTDFRCQALNRDIWRQQIIKDVVAKDFVFFQTSTEIPEGARLTTRYVAHAFPFIAAIDPKTGEMKRTFERYGNITDMLEDLANYALDNPAPTAASAVAAAADVAGGARGGSATGTRAFGGIHNMTEDEQLAAAIAASELESNRSRRGARRNVVTVGSDSEGNFDYDDDDDDDSYSEIHTISSDSEGLIGDDDAYDDEFADHSGGNDDMDVDSVSMARERMSSQHAAASSAAAAQQQQQLADVGPGSWYGALPSVAPDEPELGPSTTRIQLRFPNGQRVVRRFAKSDKVKTIFQYLKATLPEAASEIPEVMFMGSRLEDIFEQTIEEAKLVNASIVVDV
ncbi:UBX domain protein Ubx2 [Coemansia sp. RSA 2598]|nr:UBX domain protein Ubx2 [Coemansia sp. RSA 2598]